MNIIFTYKATAPLTEEEQTVIDTKSKYTQIHKEMRVVEEFDVDGNIISKTIPFQADVDSQADFDELKALLEQKGVVTIIGQWNGDGSPISYDVKLYRDALKDVEIFEDTISYSGVDYTGREADYIPEPMLNEAGKPMLDFDGNPRFVFVKPKRGKRVKSSRRPTLSEAKNIVVNSFDVNFNRKIK